MSHLTTFYDDGFNDKLRAQKTDAATPAMKGGIADFAKRVGRMADSGGGITQVDLERSIGRNDLLRFNYLSRGIEAGKAVCRIYIADKFGGGGSWGTGFLITPGLIITNNHVIPDIESAARAFAEFGYEADNNGVLLQGKRFTLKPEKAFITSLPEELDLTIVAIAEIAEDGLSAVEAYGFIRMNPSLNKVDELEFVSIIQHPGGDEKYISIRENKVIKIGDDNPVKNTRIWYESDTAPGSSGAAVFNDQWQVVAMHHSGVAESKKDENGQDVIQLMNGDWVPKNDEGHYADKIKYIANEGIRTSKIIEFVKQFLSNPDNQQSNLTLVKEFLDDVLGIRPISSFNVKGSIVNNTANLSVLLELAKAKPKNIWPMEHYAGRAGYKEDFLGVDIALPIITENALKFGTITKVTNTTDNVLRYTHFSVIHNSERKIAFITGVNIDGKKWTNITRGTDKWYYDSRIPLDVQLGEEIYSGEPSGLGTKGWFDRGHLVRRQDPDWGTMQEAAQADEDTFHWANCSPQYWEFNQGKELWQGIENYILYNTDKENVKASVFTGPVFDMNDELHRGVQIPQFFFKVVAVVDSTQKLYTSAYTVSQKKWAQNIPFEELPVGEYNHSQTTIAKIESQTGLKFADVIKAADVLAGQQNDVNLRSLADIRHPRRP